MSAQSGTGVQPQGGESQRNQDVLTLDTGGRTACVDRRSGHAAA